VPECRPLADPVFQGDPEPAPRLSGRAVHRVAPPVAGAASCSGCGMCCPAADKSAAARFGGPVGTTRSRARLAPAAGAGRIHRSCRPGRHGQPTRRACVNRFATKAPRYLIKSNSIPRPPERRTLPRPTIEFARSREARAHRPAAILPSNGRSRAYRCGKERR
jgi:hypothetical protein